MRNARRREADYIVRYGGIGEGGDSEVERAEEEVVMVKGEEVATVASKYRGIEQRSVVEETGRYERETKNTVRSGTDWVV